MELSISEETVLARQEAIAQVNQLLQSPENLRHVAAYREEYLTCRHAVKEQLRLALSKQVDQTLTGLRALEDSKSILQEFQRTFQELESCCKESCALFDAKNDVVRRLATVHSNIRRVIANAELISNLPKKAYNVEEALNRSGDADLVQTYVRIAELEATAFKIQKSLRGADRVHTKQMSSLQTYFGQVYHAMSKFEERLWIICRSFLEVSVSNPSRLLSAMKVIEIQERLDAELVTKGDKDNPMRRRWKHRCLQQLSAKVQELFAPILQRASKIVAAGDRSGETLLEVLDETLDKVKQIQVFKRHGAQCFPSKYNILACICEEYHKHVSSVVSLAGLSANQLTNGDIIKAIAWIGEYELMISQCAGSIMLSCFSDDSGGALLLLNEYINRVTDTLNSWIDNLIEVEFASGPSFTAEGQAWTPGAIDLYRILNEQLIAASKGGPLLVSRMAFESARALRAFQSALRAELTKSPFPLEILCALANNSSRCRVLGEEFSARVREFLAEAHDSPAIENLSPDEAVTEACESFLQIGDFALMECVSIVFSDRGFAELFKGVANSEGWMSGTITGSIIATLDDYWQDFERLLLPSLRGVLARKLTKECVAHFVASIITQLRTVQEAVLQALRRDATKLRLFFDGLASIDDSEALCQPILDIVEFLSSDSVESFVLSYTSILDSCPGISPAYLTNLLAARVSSSNGEMTKADAKEVLEACRQFYQTRQQITDSSDSVNGFQSGKVETQRSIDDVKISKPTSRRDVAFVAALNAAKKQA